MLSELYIRNLAVLPEASIEFEPGLNIVTGETGSGKSIVVDALELLAGARASQELIRTGSETLRVVGVFTPSGKAWSQALAAAGISHSGDGLVIRREVSRSGRNRVFIDDEPATLRLLTRLAPSLLRIHTQREEMGLFEPELQRAWLDQSGGEVGAELLGEVETLFDTFQGFDQRLARLEGDERSRLERLDLLRFQQREIAAASLQVGEEVALLRDRQQLRHSETFREALGASVRGLFDDDGASVERIAKASQALKALQDWEPDCAEWLAELAEIQVRLEDLTSTLRARLDRVEADPMRLDAVEDRLAELERLFKKYGADSAEVLRHLEAVSKELRDIGGDEAHGDQLRQARQEALGVYHAAADKLSGARRGWGDALGRAVARGLDHLGLGHAQFEVRLQRRSLAASPLIVDGRSVEFHRAGYDRVEFWFTPNPGQEARPLAKIASGGELSRVFLSLQSHLQRHRSHPELMTMVFDEADSGLGGAEAAALGKELKRLASSSQLIAVTHSPQVACFSDHHLKVAKTVQDDETAATVESLDPSRRIEEIARMLGGEEVTQLTLSHARELIDKAEREVA